MKTTGLTLLLAASILGAACSHSRMAVRPVSYDVEARLEPSSHRLEADVSIDLERLESRTGKKRAKLELLLNPALEIESVALEGATLRRHRTRKGDPARHLLWIEDPQQHLRVSLSYAGTLEQDVASGEKAGEIHNFEVSAHVAEEGIYLAPGGYWYPRFDLSDDDEPELGLSDWALAVPPVEGFELVAGVERQGTRADGTLTWTSPFPLDGLVLLGGPLERTSRRHDGIELHVVLAPGKTDVAEDILDASVEYLDQYQKLIGPYPFTEFTVLEAFFSSGFAFPTCTQIAGSQLSRYKQYRRHGYLDHELLHNWYGNGIFVDPRDGNWCEGLASYMGNYYGHVLDGDESGARKQRRNQSNFLSAIDPERDLPLGTFGQEDGAGRGIGYQKTAQVFHMLERKIGNEAMFAGLRRLTDEKMGTYASWQDLQAAFQAVTDVPLDGFFEQWVRTGGAPLLELVDAEYSGGDRVAVTIAQEPTEFELDVPLRLHYAERHVDVDVRVDAAVETVEVACELGLTAVELDPDYHLFRKLKPDEVLPTSGLTSRAETLLVVVPEGELDEGYQVLLDDYTPDPDDDEEATDVRVVTTSELDPATLIESSLLILGSAVRHEAIVALLGRTRSPVTWNESGFEIEDERYDDPRQAVFLTVHHPDVAEGGITVYGGNGPAALSNAAVLGYYANSLLVFSTPAEVEGVEAGNEMPRAEVVRRMDFEFHERIDFPSVD